MRKKAFRICLLWMNRNISTFLELSLHGHGRTYNVILNNHETLQEQQHRT